ncbi:MAG: GNAT family N-acetyltransferase [Myxococcota bacterium]
MNRKGPYEVTFRSLRLVEPVESEVRQAAAELAGWYSDPVNMRLMTATAPMSPSEVEEWYAEKRARRERTFLIRDGQVLVGDADFRNITHSSAEFAIMIGNAERRGKGLGTRAAIALHRLAFLELGMKSLCLSVSPFNTAAIRSYRKLGYVEEAVKGGTAPDEPEDVTMKVELAAFLRLHGSTAGEVVVARRSL